MTDWTTIKEQYIEGGVSYQKLAALHGVSRGTLAKIARQEHWTELREQKKKDLLAQTVLPDIDTDADTDRKEPVPDIIGIADKLLFRLSELVDLMVLDTQGLKQAASALKELRDIKEYQSELDLRQAKIRKLEQEMAKEEDGAQEIKIVFLAGPERWNE